MTGGSGPILPARRPVAVLLVATALGAVAAAGAGRLQPSAALAGLVSRDDPASAALVRIMEAFPVADHLSLVVTDDTGAAAPQARRRLLAFAGRLRDELRGTPPLDRMCEDLQYGTDPEGRMRDFLESVVAPNGLLYLSPPEFEAARRRLSAEGIRRQIERNEAALAAGGTPSAGLTEMIRTDPLRLREVVADRRSRLTGRFDADPQRDEWLSSDGRSLLIRLSGARPVGDFDFTTRFVQEVKAAVARAGTEDLAVEYTGAYAIATVAAGAVRRDMIVSVVCSVVLIQILFLAAYRDRLSFLTAIVPVGLGILTGFGAFSLLRTTLTPATAVVGAILAGLGIDYAVHVISHFSRASASGQPSAAAVSTAVRTMRRPLAAAAVTSLLALLAISRSSLQALRDFGLLAALGLAAALLACFVVLPALVVVLRSRPRSRAAGLGPRGRADALLWAAAGRWRLTVAAMLAVWVALAAVVIVKRHEVLAFEPDLTALHPRPNRPLELEGVVAERFGGAINTFPVLLRADTAAELVGKAHEASRRLRAPLAREAGVAGVWSIADLLPDPSRLAARIAAVRAIDAGAVLDDFRAALRDSVFDPAAFAGYERYLRRLLDPRDPPALDDLLAAPGVARDLLPRGLRAADAGGPFETIVLARLSSPLNERAARADAIETVRSLLEGVPGAVLTGMSVLGHDTEQVMSRELARLLAAVVVLVAIFLVLVFRSARRTLLVLIPALFALTCVPAMMVLTGDRLNMINLLALPLVVGLGVDDGIVLVGIARGSGAARHGRAALIGNLAASCHALTVTSLTTMLAFGSLVFTSTPAVRSLGRIVVVGMAACLAATLLVLAPILVRGAGDDRP